MPLKPPSPAPLPAPPVRPVAPHVQRAAVLPLQAKRPEPQPPAQAKPAGSPRPLAAHVQAALGAVQAKLRTAAVPPVPAAPRTRLRPLLRPLPIQMAAAASGRSLRARAAPAVVADRTALRAGYTAFNATETDDTKSGTATTKATLTISGINYEGSSGTGHAEMDALNDMLLGKGGTAEDLEEIRACGGKTVTCTAKPCCYRCSVVLGLLGFAPSTAATRKTASGMGSTQWVLQEPLRSVLTARYGDIQTLLANFSNASDL